MNSSQDSLTRFLEQNTISEMMAGAFLKAKGSEKTQASYISTLSNQIATMATDEKIAWVLSGNDFDFNLIDPEHPKMFAVSNNFFKELCLFTCYSYAFEYIFAPIHNAEQSSVCLFLG